MYLTPADLDIIMQALSGKVNPDVLALVKKTLGNACQDNTTPPGETYQDIKSYSERLLSQYEALGRGVTTNSPQEETLVVFMEPKKVSRLMSLVPPDGYIAAFPGIHTTGGGKDQITISLLAADKNRNIIPEHITGSVNGEESWDNCDVMGKLHEVLRLV